MTPQAKDLELLRSMSLFKPLPDATFQRLMDELAGTENRLATERMRYNERLQEYNTLRRRFPSNVTAKMFGFKEYPYFEAPPEATKAPTVNFGR